MEAEAAGVVWPQLNLKPSTTRPEPGSESEAEEADTSQAQISSTPGDDASRKIFRAEKRKRKAERAAKRAAKQARRQARESAASSSLLIEQRKEVEEEEEPWEGNVLVPPSSAPAGPSLSFPEVSTSPVEDDEKSDDVSTQSVKIDQPSQTQPASTIDTNPSTESQPSSAPDIVLSSNATPTPDPPARSKGVKNKGKGKARASEPVPHTNIPSDDELDQDTLDASLVDSSIPEQADLERTHKPIASSSKSRPNINAEVGPSKPRAKKSKNKNQLPTPDVTPPSSPAPLARKPIKQKKPRESGVSDGRTVEKEDIEHLRRILDTPSAAHEYIASSYWTPPHLKRLEEAGSEFQSSMCRVFG